MSSFELDQPEVFTAGTIGPPGQRVFYLQARDGDLVVTVRCEKQQVAALADYLEGLLDDLEPAPVEAPLVDTALAEPVQELWTVGPIGVAYDDTDDRIVVVLEELTDLEEEPAEDGDSVKVRLSRPQVAGFVRLGRELVASGRPPCRFCGLPVDPAGHPCPRMN